MKNTFINLVQKCICLDFLINSLINSNSYQDLSFLSSIKTENLRNIKFICYLYNYTFKEDLVLENVDSIKVDKKYENNFNYLIKLNLNILSDLESLKKYNFDVYYLKLLQSLIYSYFNFVSSIQYFFEIVPDKKINYNKTRFFNMPDTNLSENISKESSIEYIRKTSINAIDFFFNYSLDDNKIIDEYYEIFFENNFENKFYQYFFKTNDSIFKIRVLYKSGEIFYLYQSHIDDIKISPPLSKEESKTFIDNYLQEKFIDEFENLLYDKNYLKTYTYDNSIEGYKFKYDYKENSGKINFNKAFYITINPQTLVIEEISLF
jgi:hypothetical protein